MMNLIRSVEAWYPNFPIGCEPVQVKCDLSIIEANGRFYLRTPFAMLDCKEDEDLSLQFRMDNYRVRGGYFRTEEEVKVYQEGEYPHWELAQPIMEMAYGYHHRGDSMYPIADLCDVSLDNLFKLARGHRSFTKKQVRAAVRALKKAKEV
jgi:hypothetical protein